MASSVRLSFILISINTLHLVFVLTNQSDGYPEVAGFTITPDSLELDNSERKMNGSMLVVAAANMAEVRTIIESDPYWDGKVVCPQLLHQQISFHLLASSAFFVLRTPLLTLSLAQQSIFSYFC